MTIGLGHYLTVSSVLFTLGILGIFLNRKNVIVILMCVELMLLAVNINFVAFSIFEGNVVGQIFAMLVLTVAAAEAAIGLAILVVYFREHGLEVHFGQQNGWEAGARADIGDDGAQVRIDHARAGDAEDGLGRLTILTHKTNKII